MRNHPLGNQGYRRMNMGDLPEQLAQERNDGNLPPPPLGLPPNGGAQGVTQQRGNAPVSFDQSQWGFVTFRVGTEPLKIQDYMLRKFLLIQNKSLTGTIYVGFGYIPTALNALELLPQIGYEPFRYPTNEIYVVGTEPDIEGLLLFGT